MDSLLEALQSGAAFRDRRKRTPRGQGKIFPKTLSYKLKGQKLFCEDLQIVLTENY